MARPDREAVETFISITGASEEVALRKLEEHYGDLIEAINAHFGERDRNFIQNSPIVPEVIDGPIHVDAGSTFSVQSSVNNLNPISHLNPEFRPSFLNGDCTFTSHYPFVSHPREVKEVPVEFKDGHKNCGYSGNVPTIEKITGSVQRHDSKMHDEDDIRQVSYSQALMHDTEDIQPAVSYSQALKREGSKYFSSGSASQSSLPKPSGPGIGGSDYTNDIEEQMIQAAIEASTMDAEKMHEPEGQAQQSQPTTAEDVELDHAVYTSLKTAKHKPLHHMGHKAWGSLMSSNGRLNLGSSSLQDEVEDAKKQSLVRHRSTHNPHTASSHSANQIKKAKVSASSSAERHTVSDLINFHEWGGISTPEHVEALMFEAALSGGIPEGSSFHFMQKGLHRNQDLYPQRTHHPPSPGLASQQLIREQQDDEFHASLQADREKELKAVKDAEAHRLEEQTVKEGSIDAARLDEEELCIRLDEEQEIERHLAAKESSLPKEPMVDDENAVNLLVRMPDGSRHYRRFLKSDNLQSLFDFIDVGRVVKPGSYRLVRPYPRRAFSYGESGLSLKELGFTGKQEALFLELM